MTPTTDNTSEAPKSPLRVYCRQCGAPAGFDIIRQTYRCVHCGSESGVTAEHTEHGGWRPVTEATSATSVKRESVVCPSCGAHVVFKGDAASATCEFCDTRLVRAQLADELAPELIIPFYITLEEARDRLLGWARKHKGKPEAKAVLDNIDSLTGSYLPYQLVRGPVEADVTRGGTQRKYHCRGYIEGNPVCTAFGIDTSALNAAEPFDWSAAQPFDNAFLAGQDVRLRSVPPGDLVGRIQSETEADFLPEVRRVMHTGDVSLSISTSGLETISVLLPMYYISRGGLTAAVNGQTGRVAVTERKTKKRRSLWFIEPAIFTVIAAAAIGWATEWNFFVMLVAFMIAFGTFFGLMCGGSYSLLFGVILRSKESRARRENERIRYIEGKDILSNPLDNTPVFYEKNREGEEVPVKIRFYSFFRWVRVFVKLIVFNFLPAIMAAGIRFLQISGTGEGFFDHFEVMYGAAWYVMSAFITILYWTKGVREDVYNHPILYEILPDGQKRLMGSFFSRGLGLISMFGKDPPPGEKRFSIKDIKYWLSENGCVVGIVAAVTLFFLLGSTFAIVM